MYDEITGPAKPAQRKHHDGVDWVNNDLFSGVLSQGVKCKMRQVLTDVYGGDEMDFYLEFMDEIPAIFKEKFGHADQHADTASTESINDLCRDWCDKKQATLH